MIAYKPVPGALTGTVVGAHDAGAGRLVYCQYRLARPAAAGDPAARAILGDLLRWIARPRPVVEKRVLVKDDGRSLTEFCWREETAR